ncbi:MAG: alpha/beta hydrolase [Pseudomonadales bacterium]
MIEFTERFVQVAGHELKLLEAGSGSPLLVCHDELGHPGALAWHAALAKTHKLIVPIQPGFVSERIPWLRSVRDLAAFYGFLVRQEGWRGCDVIGFSFGGWVAAEMAVGDPDLFNRMVLVAPFGIKPKEDFIMDMFPIASADYLRASVKDPQETPEFEILYGEPSPQQFEDWEDARAECARLAWQPYMHNLSLPDLLRGVRGPAALILRGADDAILPMDAARCYAASLPDAQLTIFPDTGHRPEVECTAAFLDAVTNFLH